MERGSSGRCDGRKCGNVVLSTVVVGVKFCNLRRHNVTHLANPRQGIPGILRVGREIKDAGEARGTRGRQQVLVGGTRFSWESASSRGRQQVLVRVSKFSWELADCLLGKTARRSSVSGIGAEHMKMRPCSAPNNIRVPVNCCQLLKALKKLRLRLVFKRKNEAY
jgi:hypothetical protein